MPNIRDKLWLPGGWEEKLVRGKVRLETFDAESGKRRQCQVAESENYVTDSMVNYMKWVARGTLKGQMAAGVTNTDTQAGGNLLGFVLTNATHAEDPTNDRLIRGATCAYGLVGATYAGASSWRGNINTTESSIQPTKIIYVIDWPTSSGNGTINSVYGAPSALDGAEWLMFPQMMGQSVGTGSSWIGPTGSAFYPTGGFFDPDGVSYWTHNLQASGGTAYTVKRTIGTGVVVNTINFTGLASGYYPYGCANDGLPGAIGNWWIMHGNNTLYKFAAAGGAPTASYTGKARSGSIMTYGAGYLYTYGAGYFDQYSVATGGLVTSITPLFPPPGGIYAIGNYQPRLTTLAYYSDPVNGDQIWGGYYPSHSYAQSYIGKWSLSGIMQGTTQLVSGLPNNPGATCVAGPTGAILEDFGYSGATAYYMNTYREFNSRSLLPSPVVKSNTQTMKLTYEYDYS